MGKLLIFIMLLVALCSCVADPLEPETIFIHDTLYIVIHDTTIIIETDTLITYAQLSVNLIVNGRWGSDYLVAYLIGTGVNVSNDTINNVSIEFTLSAGRFREGILSETIGYFLVKQPLAIYIPNDPFPYEIQHRFDPYAGHPLFVSADTVYNVNWIYWYFRIIVGDGLSKQVSDWRYGGELVR